MSTYFIDIKDAIWIFVVVALIITIPYVIYAYRKYGGLSIMRIIIVFSFIFYLEAAFLLTVLPLPDPKEVAELTTPYYNLHPFRFISDFRIASGFSLHDPTTWIPAMKQPTFYIPVFNVLMTFPFGIYLGDYFQKKFWMVLILTFTLSLFFELTQLSGLYGLYPRPYRLFDVDDLMLNTLGGVLGYLFYLLFQKLLPNKDKIDQRDLKEAGKVTYMKRFFAFVIDSIVILTFSIFLNFLVNKLLGNEDYLVQDYENVVENPGWQLLTDRLLYDALLLILYCSFFVFLTRGRTLGKLLLKIAFRDSDTRKMIFVRYLLRNLVIISVQVLNFIIELEVIQWPFLILELLILILSVIDFVYAYVGKKDLWYGRITHTSQRSTFKIQIT